MRPLLLALDPSARAFGWAVLGLAQDAPELLVAGVLETKPTTEVNRRKAGLTVAEDDARCARYLRRGLGQILTRWHPDLVAIEASAGSQSSKAAKLLALGQAVAACVVDEEGLSPIYLTAHAAGDALGIQRTQRTAEQRAVKGADDKARKARKGAIASAVVERFGVEAWRRALGLAEGLRISEVVRLPRFEGAHDAAALGLAALDRPEVSAVRRMARNHEAPLRGPEAARARGG